MEDQETIKPVQQEGAEQEQTLEQNSEQEPQTNVAGEKNYFDIAYSSVLGFLCAILIFVLILFSIAGLGYWVYKGYVRWFSTEGMVEVGCNGYYFDAEHECFVKPMPNRRVLEGCQYLEHNGLDSIGIVRLDNNYLKYVNLNTLTFLNSKQYDRAELFHNGKAMAITEDSVYHISTDGKTICAESSLWVYASIEELNYEQIEPDEDGLYYAKEEPTGLLVYQDAHHNYGLMSADFVRLTPAIYSEITAESKDVYFCEYLDSGLGVLIDRNGKILK